jgi:hypothetical protein
MTSMISRSNDLHIPQEFSGPAQILLYTRYGDPREPGWEQKWMTSWQVKALFSWFPAESIYIHKHFQPLLEKAFHALSLGSTFREIKTLDKDFHIGFIHNDPGVLSVHSWGAAIDMNSADNPVGSAGNWSREFIDAMSAHQIFCGQSWSGRKDPRHFAMVDG